MAKKKKKKKKAVLGVNLYLNLCPIELSDEIKKLPNGFSTNTCKLSGRLRRKLLPRHQSEAV